MESLCVRPGGARMWRAAGVVELPPGRCGGCVPWTERVNLTGARSILKIFQLMRELKDTRCQRACHNACSEERTVGVRFTKAFESCLNEKSMEIDFSPTSKSWCSVFLDVFCPMLTLFYFGLPVTDDRRFCVFLTGI